jgi:hypothetical protein
MVDRTLRGQLASPEVRVRAASGGYEVEPRAEAAERRPAAAGAVRDARRRRRHLRLFPYAVSSPRLERVIRELRVPAVVVDRLQDADCVVTLKSQEKRMPKALRAAADGGRPLHVLRNGTTGQIETLLRRLFDVGDVLDEQQVALREVETAVAEVIGGGRAVELAPQASFVRRLQHEMIERAGLASTSRGDEPFRRVVIYPL